MRAILADGVGGPEVLRIGRADTPRPRAGEVLIRVEAAGVNRPDVSQRKGAYPPPPDASPLIGLEVAGEVVALGEGAGRWRVGDRVCALTNGGGYAEYCAAPEGQCLRWPAGYDAIRAAALPENHFTVWSNVFEIGRLAPGETLLVHGGTSGIGVTAIQLARAFGSRVYATAGNTEKCARCVELGADAAIDYRAEDFEARIGELTGKRGVDVVLDMVGAPYFPRNVRSLAFGGRLVQIAFLQGAKVAEFDLAPIMVRRLTVTGSTMRPRSAAEKAALAVALHDRVWPLLDAGRCGPVIHAVFDLAEASHAHRLMEASTHVGKIMLRT